ncbi:hypothetical protein O181_006439 [Austropuccinia psidii MF-1]|uniref:Integrase zinc-binding domain-containing protein n=1 Tax=Austropuccinia psidii MF-1 TaxID=1389203 RepID=A0A9Q3BJA5_9BASI|nr:hypothetical protein [Austropuccinia psidii MF-1]
MRILVTPSLPPSVHIPSIKPSQSLLPSRDEGFNEIKDVGEDFAIYSLHLFQGDMDLPPLSFHASLDEKRESEEEPEEIEAVLKVVPLANHQYLDVLSKVKAEKLPPHCARDHYIELEGLLPPKALSQFQILKAAFNTAPILSHFNASIPAAVETNASYYAFPSVLTQVNDSGMHPMPFDSHKRFTTDLNYEIYDKKLFDIVCALKHWRAFLLSLSDPFEFLTDHSSLQYFMFSKVLTHHQVCWSEFFSEFHLTSTYFPGRLATLPDAFSCWNDVYPERVVDFIRKNPQIIKVEFFSDLVDQIQKEVWKDKEYKEILKKLASGESLSDYSLEPQSKLLLLKDRVVTPSNQEIQLDLLQKHHELLWAGHPSQEKTPKLIKRDFYWAGMNQIIKEYVHACQICSRNKKIYHKKFGLLKPLQIPSGT